MQTILFTMVVFYAVSAKVHQILKLYPQDLRVKMYGKKHRSLENIDS